MNTRCIGGATTRDGDVITDGRGRIMQIAFALLTLAVMLDAHPAYAQISKVNSVVSNIQTVLLGIAVTLFTVAIMWAGYKMAFQASHWNEVSNIVFGGILVGGAAGIAAWLIN